MADMNAMSATQFPGFAELDAALADLRQGKLVAIPTETVYGLAADASNPDAVKQIFSLKGRPADHPVIVHIAGAEQLPDWASQVPDAAWQLAEAFWPGPLTLILPKPPRVTSLVTGGQETVGIRAPAHPLTHELLRQFGGGLAAPSANRFGHISPTTAEHVRGEFGHDCPRVLDGGACHVGVESTIVSLIGDTPKLLRPGGIPREAIEDLLGQTLEHHQSSKTAQIRASGLLDSHYAPRTPLWAGSLEQVHLAALQENQQGHKVALIALGSSNHLPEVLHTQCLPAEPEAYARLLYATLRSLDGQGFDTLLLQMPPDHPAWLAVRDRLTRAAHRHL